MNNPLLEKLAKAQTEEERSWILTESLLATLSPELTAAVWAVVVPHWFNAEILAALRPELQAQSSQLYTELQALPFVEEFPGRGHNVHDLTRRLMLNHLWQEHQDEFMTLSQRAAEYFSSSNEHQAAITEQPESQIEWLYHLIVVDREWKGRALCDLAQNWVNNFRIAEIESLIATLLEQIAAARVAILAQAEVYYWVGQAKFRVYQALTALESYEAALALYRDIGVSEAPPVEARLGEANTLRAIGDVLQFLDRRTEALERYEAALALYREIGDPLGEANTLRAIGDVLGLLKRSMEALERYKAALALYREISDPLGEANTLKAIGDVLQFLKRSMEALERYKAALALYRKIDDPLGEANTLKAIGDVLQLLDRRTEALERYEAALAFYRDIGIGARLGEANTLQAIGSLQADLTVGLEYCQAALALYRQIGNKYSQSRNLIYYTSPILLKLGRETEAREALHQAIELAREIPYEYFVEAASARLREIPA